MLRSIAFHVRLTKEKSLRRLFLLFKLFIKFASHWDLCMIYKGNFQINSVSPKIGKIFPSPRHHFPFNFLLVFGI